MHTTYDITVSYIYLRVFNIGEESISSTLIYYTYIPHDGCVFCATYANSVMYALITYMNM
jgi:hypothetical protein